MIQELLTEERPNEAASRVLADFKRRAGKS